MDDDFRLARAYLSRIAEPPAPALSDWIELLGPVEAAESVRTGRLTPEVDAEIQRRNEPDRSADDLAFARQTGARLVCPEDDEWPIEALAGLGLAQAEGLSWAAPPVAL